MNSEILNKCANIAIESTLNMQSEQKTIQLIEQSLKENSNIIDEFEANKPSVDSVISENREKDEQIKKKREELLKLQQAYIRIKSLKKKEDSQEVKSWEPIPIVVNRAQDLIMKLSETAINENSIGVPILSIFKVNDAINTLYDISVEEGFIQETDDEKQIRLEEYAAKQKHVLDILNEHVSEKEEVSV